MTQDTARVDRVARPMPGVIYPDPVRLAKYLSAGELPRRGLIDGLMDSFTRNADRAALWYEGETVTYADLDVRSDRAAAGFLALGMKPLDRALFQMRNSPEFYVAFIGCLKAGIIPICSLLAHREHEIEYLATEGHARMHLVDGDDPRFDLVAFARAVQTRTPTLKFIVAARGAPAADITRLDALTEAQTPEAARATVAAVPRDPFQVAIFQLSGGTTGVPKIIPRFQNDYLLNMTLTIERLGYRADDTMFIAYPPIHNAAMGCCWGPTLLAGGTVAIASELSGESFARLITDARPTWIAQLISGLTPYFQQAQALGADFSSVRALWQAGSTEMAEQARAWLGVPTWQMFGMTEGLNLYPRTGDPEDVWKTTLGRPLSDWDEVVILEPEGSREVRDGEVGEMACRGPFIVPGYFNAPARNREAFTEDGFYRSGDLMSRVRIGGLSYFRYEGRLKDVISRGGEKINAAEVEGVLLRHPAVMHAAVVAYPCPRMGERACAMIVLKADAPGFDLAELQRFFGAVGVAKFKWPERVQTVAALSLTKVGKIDKAAMKKAVIAALEQEGQAAA
ncbi:2,3-dihydroxybenzoate-AMP ligase [Brevundimonas sp. NIBR10]|uniref:AMP-binding protein n=1 Tax=Brevundimonas sp. NIBR10 TaxID=3015997 RepID=UPI0022F1C750|nr:AMP-binding protein [Brevundimonas sp. NIBR10]WGM45925.1 2,3-dihydroxybenzoate-AMP ligase [Brevundimonas sp. NIBR10]